MSYTLLIFINLCLFPELPVIYSLIYNILLLSSVNQVIYFVYKTMFKLQYYIKLSKS